MNKQKWLIWGGIAALVLILAISLGNIIYNNIYSAKVNMIVAPSSIAKVKIGEDWYSAKGEYKIKPGEYDVIVSADGFETRQGKLVAVAHQTANVSVYLNPLSGNENWYNEHSEDALIMGEIINAENVKKLQELGEKNPILNKLPYTVDFYTKDYSKRTYYTVSYELEKSGFFLVIKDFSGGNKEAALKWIREQGVDLEEVEVKYSDLTHESMSGRAE